MGKKSLKSFLIFFFLVHDSASDKKSSEGENICTAKRSKMLSSIGAHLDTGELEKKAG